MSGHDHHDHDHKHEHGHDHGAGGHHHHHELPAGFDAAFAIGSALNAGFVVAEVVFGLAAHSVALLADAAHNLGDVLGLLLAWGAETYAAFRSVVSTARLNHASVVDTIQGVLAAKRPGNMPAGAG